jgi:hypothetical protein
VNFSIFSGDTLEVELLFFPRKDGARPAHAVSIDAFSNRSNRTCQCWHVFVEDVQPGNFTPTASRAIRAGQGAAV